MNNAPAAPAGPWWFTAVVAGITALATLLAGGLSTFLTLRYTHKKHKAELEHKDIQERYKLLYADRRQAYLSTLRHLRSIVSSIEGIAKIQDSIDSQSPEISANHISQIRGYLQKLEASKGDLHQLNNELMLVARMRIVVKFGITLVSTERIIAILMQSLTSAAAFKALDLVKIHAEGIRSNAQIVSMMQEDLGVITDSDPSFGKLFKPDKELS
ncbi:hypothetical protein [Amycolatopsis sp. lyj-112]|uniref:hypothetical protein n=1 Tax=Amycolatopsis sp. lyj-112 TaxID=2789288 RepID=UPI003979FB73